ncbi:MAG: molybdenum cofactor guanylyltransferase [Chloroflexota bacterium]
MQVTGAILAGGKSSRLGRSKLFQTVAGRPLIEWMIGRVEAISKDVVVVVSDADTARSVEESARTVGRQTRATGACGVRVVQDLVEGCGPLGGIFTALTASSSPRCLVVGCDMPFLRQELLEYLVLASHEYDAAVPRVGSFIEPLCAVYDRRCLPYFAEAVRHDEFQVGQALRRVNTRFVEEAEIETLDPHHYSFFNVNTRAELETAREMAADNPRLLAGLCERVKEKW